MAAGSDDLAGAALEYCVEHLLIHLDDSAFDFQQYVYQALSQMIELSVASATAIARKLELVKGSQRDETLCRALLKQARSKQGVPDTSSRTVGGCNWVTPKE